MKLEVAIKSLIINFLLFSVLGWIFGDGVGSLILVSTLIICANLWGTAEYIKPNKN